MALLMECGVCGTIEKASSEQVFRGQLINHAGIEVSVELRMNTEQSMSSYNKDRMDHICVGCIKKVILKGRAL